MGRVLTAVICVVAAWSAEAEPFALSYRQPARNWFEAMPLGNGRLGAMAFGGVESDCLVLNEDTIWTGRPLGRGNEPSRRRDCGNAHAVASRRNRPAAGSAAGVGETGFVQGPLRARRLDGGLRMEGRPAGEGRAAPRSQRRPPPRGAV